MHKFDVHRIFYGRSAKISNYQIRVYGSPRVKAIESKEADKEKAQTAIVLALAQAFDASTRSCRPVYLFAPELRLGWICLQIESMAKNLAQRLRSEVVPGNKEDTQRVLRVLKEWVAHIHPGSPEKWMPVAPERWTAFGYMKDDPLIPEWLRLTLG